MVHDVGEADGAGSLGAGQPFYTMELVDGRTLEELLAARGALPSEQVAGIVTSLGAAVDHLHAAGIVHRDIKASNVMVDGSGRVVLMDFGIARVLEGTLHTRTGGMLGTPEAMTPEQVQGKHVGPPADIYALGVLAYQLLAGRPPVTGDLSYLLFAHAYKASPSLRRLPPGLAAPVHQAVTRALAKDPATRPASAGNFAEMLAAGLAAPGAPAARTYAPGTPVVESTPFRTAPGAPDAPPPSRKRARRLIPRTERAGPDQPETPPYPPSPEPER